MRGLPRLIHEQGHLQRLQVDLHSGLGAGALFNPGQRGRWRPGGKRQSQDWWVEDSSSAASPLCFCAPHGGLPRSQAPPQPGPLLSLPSPRAPQAGLPHLSSGEDSTSGFHLLHHLQTMSSCWVFQFGRKRLTPAPPTRPLQPECTKGPQGNAVTLKILIRILCKMRASKERGLSMSELIPLGSF